MDRKTQKTPAVSFAGRQREGCRRKLESVDQSGFPARHVMAVPTDLQPSEEAAQGVHALAEVVVLGDGATQPLGERLRVAGPVEALIWSQEQPREPVSILTSSKSIRDTVIAEEWGLAPRATVALRTSRRILFDTPSTYVHIIKRMRCVCWWYRVLTEEKDGAEVVPVSDTAPCKQDDHFIIDPSISLSEQASFIQEYQGARQARANTFKPTAQA